MFPRVPLVSMSGILMLKQCVQVRTVFWYCLFFFLNTIEKHFYSSKIRRAKNVSSLEEY